MSDAGSLPPPTLLPQYAISAITTNDLVFRSTGMGLEDPRLQVPATLQRMTIPPNFIDACPHPDVARVVTRRAEGCYEPGGPIPRPPSTLPPPGHSTLSFSLGRSLGAGRSGIVFEVLDPCLRDSDSDAPSVPLPPLVAKIGRQDRCQSIVREGWFYEEMECLQGVAIPRCYGCFELKLSKGCRVGPWEDPRFATFESERSWDVLPEFEKFIPEVCHDAGWFPHPMLPRLVIERKSLYVLLMERCGHELEDGVSYSAEKDDILSVYEDVANLGIFLTDDVRSSNILSAPQCPPGIPSLPSPFTGRTHNWRVIDFGLALKTPWTKELVFKESRSWVKIMLDGLRHLPRSRHTTGVSSSSD
ncbi:uncharacterized protein STEHIDRAFT_172094 [Stereum hirsutum FP-91666 SS1]|uniref:uncharacterized protein n=1 Tax=Stereum hirsutum (strain FP-91666) TaxID=721885 RepID=UPI000444952C|nr:uncharacterized protein STEHIDRAFT_172094 [Stereum hirsutum FP-91666 SS1]EIM81047.1 hypothetical protein STEHIDRAFT_172094 [Stereum hirsutum FP-91666 SS1]